MTDSRGHGGRSKKIIISLALNSSLNRTKEKLVDDIFVKGHNAQSWTWKEQEMLVRMEVQ